MKSSGKCPKCGGSDIISDAKAIDVCGYETILAIFEKPKALLFKGKKRQTTVSPLICASCGYVEFYADSPAALVRPASP
jgi:predicted nucleic-acid-binding Zn-ribbon protein